MSSEPFISDRRVRTVTHPERSPLDARLCQKVARRQAQYLGNLLRGNIYPKILDDLIELFEGRYSEVLLIDAIGWGNGLSPGELVLMFDGSVRRADVIRIGDKLMGPDSRPRTVKQIVIGDGAMDDVIPVKGEPHRLCRHHVLPLKSRPTIGTKHSEVEMTVEELIRRPQWFRNTVKLWRTPIDFQTVHALPVEPYFLGVWLGDGTSARMEITCTVKLKAEVVTFLEEFAPRWGLTVRSKPGSVWKLVSASTGPNRLMKAMQALGLVNNKHVPSSYRIASRKDRLELLAGLLDTDGELRTNAGEKLSGYRICSAFECLADDICFVARSLGFAAYKHSKEKSAHAGHSDTYYEVEISGDVDCIPVKVERKKAPARRQKKNPLVVGFDARHAGKGSYVCFHLDGDGLFVLSDFTVMHNPAFAEVGHLLRRFYQARHPWLERGFHLDLASNIINRLRPSNRL